MNEITKLFHVIIKFKLSRIINKKSINLLKRFHEQIVFFQYKN